MNQITSLFILSLPRSLSSDIYQISSHLLGLKQPEWTSDGELLNPDRFYQRNTIETLSFPKYSNKEKNRDDFTGMLNYLDRVIVPEGYIYKDVVQPFVMAEWLKQHKYPVLIIERNLIDIAFTMLMRGWQYPTNVVDADTGNVYQRILQGLRLAEEELAKVEGERIRYEELIYDEHIFISALRRLLPDREIPKIHFIDEDFIAYREKIINRKEHPTYRQLLTINTCN